MNYIRRAAYRPDGRCTVVSMLPDAWTALVEYANASESAARGALIEVSKRAPAVKRGRRSTQVYGLAVDLLCARFPHTTAALSRQTLRAYS